MPKTSRRGKPKRSELPDTLKRSPAKAQRTFAKAHDGAVESGAAARRGGGKTHGGVDVDGRSKMSKEELAEAIARSG